MIILADLIARSSLVLAIGFAALWLLRKEPASMRHWLVVATVALAGAQPLLNRVVPAWHISNMGWHESRGGEANGADMMAQFDLPSPPAPQNTASSPRPALDWTRVIYQAWIGGTIVSSAILFTAALWLTWLTARASDAGRPWQSASDEMCRRLNVRCPVRIAITHHPALLVTWGAIFPVILLPDDADAWPPERIELVLAHELAHVLRRDWVIQLAAEMLRSFNWFNPLFWMACARLRRESEHACDDIVLELGIGGTSYAAHLLDLARTFSGYGPTWLPAPSIARPSTLERRVRAMLNPHVNRRPVSIVRRGAVALLLLGLAMPIAAASQAISTPSGTVSDPSGRPLADASVKLTALNSTAGYETRTDGAGAFQFSPVPVGEYMLAVRSPGFSSLRQRIVLTGGPTTLASQMQVGTLKETISIRGGDGDGGGKRHEQSAARPVPPSCTPSTSGGQLTPPMKIRDVRPRYKPEWAGERVQGDVLLHARIGTDGLVKSVEVVSPVNEELEDEAIAAVSQWEFTPTYLNCEPIEVRMYVTASFKIER
jgi:TonB family protein